MSNSQIRSTAGIHQYQLARDQVRRSATMRPPADQWCVEIDVTNACPNSCANCTRFTRLVSRPCHMDLPTFKRAVDSMDGYKGVLGIMGGEPTIHPQFGEMLDYYRARWHPEEMGTDARQPITDFGQYAAEHAVNVKGPSRRVIFTSLGAGYYRHFEAIQETFSQQGINTHDNGCLHQALLVTRREAGVSDLQWHRIRDACWVQRLWSASITPRGCYFCEIAGALDALYADLPNARRATLGMPPLGGWPIEPGWWKRTPAEFGDQLKWCEFCGAALATPKIEASTEIQQVSPWHIARLRELGSPVISSSKLQILNPKKVASRSNYLSDPNWYMPSGEKQRRAIRHDLSPRYIESLVVSVDCGDELRRTLPGRVKQFDKFVVVTTSRDTLTQEVARDAGAELVVSDSCYDDHASFNKGAMLNAGLRALSLRDWVVFSDADIFFPDDWRKRINGLVLNPGCLYYTRRHHLPGNATEPTVETIPEYERLDPWGNNNPWGYFQLWNVRASCLPSGRFRFPLCFASAGTVDHWFALQWPRDKWVRLPAEASRFDVYHLWHGTFAARWDGLRASEDRWRYSGQSDMHGEEALRKKWPVPCLVRRVEVVPLVEETRYFDGRPVVWSTPTKPSTLYEFSTRKEP